MMMVNKEDIEIHSFLYNAFLETGKYNIDFSLLSESDRRRRKITVLEPVPPDCMAKLLQMGEAAQKLFLCIEAGTDQDDPWHSPLVAGFKIFFNKTGQKAGLTFGLLTRPPGLDGNFLSSSFKFKKKKQEPTLENVLGPVFYRIFNETLDILSEHVQTQFLGTSNRHG